MSQLQKERRERFLKALLEEAIINVLAEQEQTPSLPSAPPGPSSAPPAATPPAAETNQAADISLTQPEPVEFTVDTMVEKLNVLRGGKSFTDPEVYGKLNTFFNGLSDEQKTSLDYMLNELNNVVLETSQQPQQQNQQQPTNNAASNQNAQQPAPAKNIAAKAPVSPAAAAGASASKMTAPISPAA